MREFGRPTEGKEKIHFVDVSPRAGYQIPVRVPGNVLESLAKHGCSERTVRIENGPVAVFRASERLFFVSVEIRLDCFTQRI